MPPRRENILAGAWLIAFCAVCASGSAGQAGQARAPSSADAVPGAADILIVPMVPDEPDPRPPPEEEWLPYRVGALQLGGEIRVGWFGGRQMRGMPDTLRYNSLSAAELEDAWAQRGRAVHETIFMTRKARLDWRVMAGPHASLEVAICLDDAWNAGGRPGQDDVLEAVYFEFRRLFGQSITARAGKHPVPFGMPDDGLTGRFLSPMDAGDANLPPGLFDPSAYSGFLRPERVYGVSIDWKPRPMRDLLSLEAGVFQDAEGRGLDGRQRSGDDLAFRSYALRASFEPFEKMALSAAFLQRHAAGAGDGRYHRAWTVGFQTPLFVVPARLYAEYRRSWRDDFARGRDSNHWKAGAVWTIRPDWRIGLRAERMSVRRSAYFMAPFGADAERMRFYNATVSVERDLNHLTTIETGWRHEWSRRRGVWLSDSGENLARLNTQGDTWYMGLGLKF